jgi:hypothetical protein
VLEESTVVVVDVVSVVAEVLELLLHAANAPIAKTINNFFIVYVFCDVIVG